MMCGFAWVRPQRERQKTEAFFSAVFPLRACGSLLAGGNMARAGG